MHNQLTEIVSREVQAFIAARGAAATPSAISKVRRAALAEYGAALGITSTVETATPTPTRTTSPSRPKRAPKAVETPAEIQQAFAELARNANAQTAPEPAQVVTADAEDDDLVDAAPDVAAQLRAAEAEAPTNPTAPPTVMVAAPPPFPPFAMSPVADFSPPPTQIAGSRIPISSMTARQQDFTRFATPGASSGVPPSALAFANRGGG